MSKKHDNMYAKIEEHGNNLKVIFNLPTGVDSVKLCKKLRTIENKAHRLAEAYCNGTIQEYDYHVSTECLLDRVNVMLGNVQREHIPIFINSDPRGYSLKIEDSFVRENNLEIYRDMGGYGIIAPDFNYLDMLKDISTYDTISIIEENGSELAQHLAD